MDKSKVLTPVVIDEALVLIMLGSLSFIEQKIVLSMFVRRFNPQQVMEDIKIKEAIAVVLDDPVDVRVDLATD